MPAMSGIAGLLLGDVERDVLAGCLPEKIGFPSTGR